MSHQSPPEPHDLDGFLDEIAASLKVDYDRSRRTARSDPGTAGDQSEAAWAGLLRAWLPATLHVATKGRIAASDGRLSQQVDVIVLRDTYPPHLVNKKIYLAGGVLAVFECKLTLRKAHLRDVATRGRELRELVGPRPGRTLRDEVLPPFLYGVLAHRSERLTSESILMTLFEELANYRHPREALDLVTVSDLGTWSNSRMVFPRRLIPNEDEWEAFRKVQVLPATGGIAVGYMARDRGARPGEAIQNPLFGMLEVLYQRLAADVSGLQPLARYWSNARVRGHGASGGPGRSWEFEILSDEVRARVLGGQLSVTMDYTDPWSTVYF